MLSDALKTNIEAIVRGASFEKTKNTSTRLGQFSKRPRLATEAITAKSVIAVISMLTFSNTNETKVAASRRNAIELSIPIVKKDFYGVGENFDVIKISRKIFYFHNNLALCRS